MNIQGKIKYLSKELEVKHSIIVKWGFEIEFYLLSTECIAELKKKFSIVEEKGKYQYEYNSSCFEDPIKLIAHLESVKREIKELAGKYNAIAYFNPKPFKNDYGSAMHIHVNLFSLTDKNNLFEKENFFQRIIFGILEKVIENIETLINKNDLERFDKKFMAPTHICWGGNNRTVLIRIPEIGEKRLEFRLPSANSDISKNILFLLKSIKYSIENQPQKFEKIHGNAYDNQYNLIPIDYIIKNLS